MQCIYSTASRFSDGSGVEMLTTKVSGLTAIVPAAGYRRIREMHTAFLANLSWTSHNGSGNSVQKLRVHALGIVDCFLTSPAGLQ